MLLRYEHKCLQMLLEHVMDNGFNLTGSVRARVEDVNLSMMQMQVGVVVGHLVHLLGGYHCY